MNTIDKCLAVGLFVGLNVSLCFSFAALGPANIVVERLEPCDNEEKYPVENNIVMKKINRTTTGFTGCIQSPVDLGPTSSVQLDLAKWGDGGWKPNAYNILENDVCELSYKYVKTALEEVLELNGLKNEGCPLKKNNYCLQDFVLSLGKLFPSVLYGKFRVDAIVLVDSKPMFCLRTVLISTPSISG